MDDTAGGRWNGKCVFLAGERRKCQLLFVFMVILRTSRLLKWREIIFVKNKRCLFDRRWKTVRSVSEADGASSVMMNGRHKLQMLLQGQTASLQLKPEPNVCSKAGFTFIRLFFCLFILFLCSCRAKMKGGGLVRQKKCWNVGKVNCCILAHRWIDSLLSVSTMKFKKVLLI